MQAISRVLNDFHEHAAWFARARELSLLVVRGDGQLRPTLLKLLPAYEFHADNRSPWIIIEDPRTAEDDGWRLRARRLAAVWQSRRQALQESGLTAPAAPLSEDADGLTAFAVTVARVLRAIAEPMSGLVVVLAPAGVNDLAAFQHEVGRLLTAGELAACRFVLLLDADWPPPATLLAAQQARALTCQCVIDPEQQQRDLEAMLSQGGASPFPAGPRLARPPRRVDDPPPVPKAKRDAMLTAAGINPAFLDAAPALRQMVFGAALAMKRGEGEQAIRLQRQARDLGRQLQMPKLEIVCQMTLASYLVSLGLEARALEELEAAARSASAHDLQEVLSQAQLSLGLLHSLGKRPVEAAGAYALAGRAAARAKAPLLAIEAWRLAGQVALQIGAERQAASCFIQAIGIARGSEPETIKTSSAPEAARVLAGLCRERGLGSHARFLNDLADRFERGQAAPPAAAPAPGGG